MTRKAKRKAAKPKARAPKAAKRQVAKPRSAAQRPKGPARLALASGPAALTAEDELLEPRIALPAAAAAEALERLRTLETLKDAYQAWAELRALYDRARASWAEERTRIEGQGAFLLGAVRAARDFAQPQGPGAALARPGGDVDAFIARTEARLAAAKQKLDAGVMGAEAGWAQALAEARDTVRGRVERTVQHARPALRLLLRSLAQNRRILHLERLTGDAPVLVHAVLSGAIPSRYDFLFDDSTDDVAQPPAPLYAEEGVTAADARGPPQRQVALLAAAQGVFPSKGIIPFKVPQPAASLSVRFLQRGPVAEAEVVEGAAWRSVLSVEEAEVIAGWLIKLQLEGKLSVTLARG